MGVLDLRKISDPYDKLECIHSKVSALCELHHPTDLAIESPFYGKNAQVILKLGRAQGAAMIAALEFGIPVTEYAPREAKQAITGNGAASKEQVCMMLEKTLGVRLEAHHLDATDALAIEDASGDAAQTYANIIAVRRGDETRAEILALVAALQDGAVDAYNEQTGAGIVPIA